MSNQLKLSLDEYGLYAGGVGSLKDIQVGDMVFPTDFQYGAECTHMKVLQFLNVSTIQSPCFATIKKGW